MQGKNSNGLTVSDKIKDRTKSRAKESPQKGIQRTVSITYKGQAKEVPVEKETMNDLTKLILGNKESQGENKFELEILGESSIHGSE